MEKINENDLESIMNLKIITKLINLLGDTKDIKKFEEKGIIFNSKIYNISKNDDGINVKCSDGRSLELKIGVYILNYGYEEKKYNYYDLKIYIPNGDIIRINEKFTKTNNESVNTFFDENHFDYNKLINDYKMDYIPKEEIYYYQLIWDKDNKLFVDRCGSIHSKDGYMYNDGPDKYLISKDLQTIISLNGKKLPSLKDINKFNYEEKKEKLNKALKQDDFSEISKDLLLELINKMELKINLVKKINKAYKHTVLPWCKQEIKKEFEINENIKNNMFSKEELTFIFEIINQININKEDSKNQSINYIDNISFDELNYFNKCNINLKKLIKK